MSKHRDTFYTEIEKGLIGPGSDIFEVDDKEELISDYPLNRYYSGILFPEKTFASGTTTPKSEEEKEHNENIATTDKNGYENSFEGTGRAFCFSSPAFCGSLCHFARLLSLRQNTSFDRPTIRKPAQPQGGDPLGFFGFIGKAECERFQGI